MPWADPREPDVHPLSNSHWIYTMYRCALAAVAALAFVSTAASAQTVQRGFPQNALRGVITFNTPPAVLLNGKSAQLAPGARIRGQNNMLEMSGALIGKKAIVNYTLEDSTGLVKDIWVLREDEIAKKPWPTTLEQARTWSFDPVAQVWTRP